MMTRNKNKEAARDTADRIQRQRDMEEKARIALAEECGSTATVNDKISLDEYNQTIDKFKQVCKNGKERFYATPKGYGELLYYHRKMNEMTLADVSNQTGIPLIVLENYENARVIPEGKNKRQIEEAVGFPAGMSIYIVDEARNYLYGTRNYAPVAQDACFAGRENARSILQELRMLVAFAWLSALTAILAAIFALLHLVPGMSSAKYVAVAFASVCAAGAFVLLILLKSVIKRQVRVKRAFYEVAISIWGPQDPKNDEKTKR